MELFTFQRHWKNIIPLKIYIIINFPAKGQLFVEQL